MRPGDSTTNGIGIITATPTIETSNMPASTKEAVRRVIGAMISPRRPHGSRGAARRPAYGDTVARLGDGRWRRVQSCTPGRGARQGSGHLGQGCV
ncbi:MAG: hypothetical protein WKF76_10260 [Nocardioidaceae bacterium]